MEITEIRVKLVGTGSEKLKAFCSITLDNEFVIRDLKIIEGNGGLFVAMPSRKLADHCGRCRAKNHLRASYCNDCGARLRPDRAPSDERGRARLHADIAHPINQKCRDTVQHRIVDEYIKERERSKQDGYVPTSFDDLDYDYEVDADYVHEAENRRERDRHGAHGQGAPREGHGTVRNGHGPARDGHGAPRDGHGATREQGNGRDVPAPREPGVTREATPREAGHHREQGQGS